MELNVTIDIESAITKALQPEKLQPILDKHITEAITSAIRDATGYRSKFSEALKEQFSNGLPHGLGLDDVAKFQHVLNEAMNRLVQECNANAVHTALEAAVKDVMPDVPAVIKMSELMEKARAGFHKEQHEAFYAYYEPSEYGGGWLYLDSDERPVGRSIHASRDAIKYSAEYRLAFNKEGEVYSMRMQDKDLTPSAKPNVVNSFDAILLAMYVGRTRLEADMDDGDVESAASAQYD